MKRYLGLLIFGAVLVFSGVTLMKGFGMSITIYNRLINSKQDCSKAIANLETEYQRRYALVDNLVGIVKETKSFEKYLVEIEKDIYVKTAEAKATATKMDISMPDKVKERIAKENGLSNILTNALDKLMVMAQKYPEIKDPTMKDRNKTFESLEKLRIELKDIEENILFARKSLNEYISVYNKNISIFPANLIAQWGNFKELPFFEVINTEARKDVKIQF